MSVSGVLRQYTDGSAYAGAVQTWSAAQAINDTQPYPASGCTENAGFPETECLLDSQLQTELERVVHSLGLPEGSTGTAPVYFIVTPATVNTCLDSSTCADNFYCAYHSSVTDPSSNQQLLYADLPLLLGADDPKGCQSDHTSAVQAPNGDQVADIAVGDLSHELSESITDPFGDGWTTSAGDESGDLCGATQLDANAFLPTLGGSAASGTLYDQQPVSGSQYYIQSEFSNGDGGCRMAPAARALTAAFSAPVRATPGTPVTFDPSASSSAGGVSSVTWSFGDGTTSFSTSGPAPVTHSFSRPGPAAVTLTLVDRSGNVATVSHTVAVNQVQASGIVAPAHPQAGAPVTFDASSSTDGNGPITAYVWSFDGGATTTTTSAPTITHVFSQAGPAAALLTVTDASGGADTASVPVTVDAVPIPRFTASPSAALVGTPVTLDASSSSEAGGSITAYRWDFGDGSTTASGSAPSHTYARAGTFAVTLTVTDQDGYTAQTTRQVTVGANGAPHAVIAVPTSRLVAGVGVPLGSAGSTDASSPLTSFAWQFGDGSSGMGRSPIHSYHRAGAYAVVLTVRDAAGVSSTATRRVIVAAAEITGVHVRSTRSQVRLTLTVDGPGRIGLGHSAYRAARAGTIVISRPITAFQRRQLTRRRRLTLRLALVFTPDAGLPSRRVVTVTLRP